LLYEVLEHTAKRRMCSAARYVVISLLVLSMQNRVAEAQRRHLNDFMY